MKVRVEIKPQCQKSEDSFKSAMSIEDEILGIPKSICRDRIERTWQGIRGKDFQSVERNVTED